MASNDCIPKDEIGTTGALAATLVGASVAMPRGPFNFLVTSTVEQPPVDRQLDTREYEKLHHFNDLNEVHGWVNNPRQHRSMPGIVNVKGQFYIDCMSSKRSTKPHVPATNSIVTTGISHLGNAADSPENTAGYYMSFFGQGGKSQNQGIMIATGTRDIAKLLHLVGRNELFRTGESEDAVIAVRGLCEELGLNYQTCSPYRSIGNWW